MSFIGKTMTVLIFLMSILFLTFAVMIKTTHVNWRAKAEQLAPELASTRAEVKSLQREKYRIKEAVKHERMALQGALIALELRAIQTEEGLAQQLKAVQAAQANRLERMAELTAIEKELEKLIHGDANVDGIVQLREKIENTKLASAGEFDSVVELTAALHEAVGLHRRLSERYDQLRGQVERIKADTPAAAGPVAASPAR